MCILNGEYCTREGFEDHKVLKIFTMFFMEVVYVVKHSLCLVGIGDVNQGRILMHGKFLPPENLPYLAY